MARTPHAALSCAPSVPPGEAWQFGSHSKRRRAHGVVIRVCHAGPAEAKSLVRGGLAGLWAVDIPDRWATGCPPANQYGPQILGYVPVFITTGGFQLVPKRLLSMALLALSIVAFPAGLVHAANDVSVQCGFFEYVAPDGKNEGNIEFGANAAQGLSGDLFVIAADAAVPANLSDLAGGSPTCLELTVDAGVITQMQYAAGGSVSGPVVVYGDPEKDPDNSVFVAAGRIAVPASAVVSELGLKVVFGNAVASGENATVVLDVDPKSGSVQSFTASTRLRGVVVMGEGDISVGPGTLSEKLIDPDSRTLLERAAKLGVDAKVIITSHGIINSDDGSLKITTELLVSFANPKGSLAGPCDDPAYYGVFDNSASSFAIRFRFKWTTNSGSHVVTKWVPAGAIYRTWEHWAKPSSLVRLSYKNPDSGLWVALASGVAVPGSFPPCVYQHGFEKPAN